MAMSFADVWETHEIGDTIRVMDGLGPDGIGSPPPTNKNGLPWKMWKSHNHRGEIMSKDTDSEGYRSMMIKTCCAITAPNCENNEITYTIQENVLHTFEIWSPE